MSFGISVFLLALVASVTTSLPGVFIVLRKNSMLVDAISHAILPGIILGFFFTHNLNSPLLVIGAALAGMLVVFGSEALSKTQLVQGDAPQGLIFPALFSFGVILVSINFQNIHLDTHAVLAGDLNLIAFNPLIINGMDYGPQYLYILLAVLVLNIVFLSVFFKPLTISTFDPEFAKTNGIKTGLLNTAFMFTVAITVTASFTAAGAVLVIALMIAPPATALLITKRIPHLIAVTIVFAILGASIGFWIAYHLDAATSAGMATVYGLIFLIVLAVVKVKAKIARQNQTSAALAVS